MISQTKTLRIKSFLPFNFEITKICVAILLKEDGTRIVYFFSALPGKNSPLRDFMFKNFPHGCTSLILPHCGCRLAYPAPQTYLN